jgi:hypothetical protein
MWTEMFVLAERIKGPLLAWTVGLILAATLADQSDVANAAILPLSIAGVVAQTFIVTAALRVGLAADAQAAIHPNVARVLGIGIVSGLAILLGGLLLVIPGVFLLIRWWLPVPIALDRNMGVNEALRESWELTAPHWASILGLFVGLLALLAVPMIGLFFLGGLDETSTSVPMSLIENAITYSVMNLGTVSTVAVYRIIYQPTAALRQVFE